MSKWKRFTKADRDTRKRDDSHRIEGQQFIISWDEAPEKLACVAYLGNMGGSGYYADIMDVVQLPDVQQQENKS